MLDHCSPRSAHHWSLTKSLSIVSCLFFLPFLHSLSSTLRPKTREKGDGAGLAPPLMASHWCPTLWAFGSRGVSFCPPCRGWGDVETSGPANLCVYARGLDLDRSFHRRQRANGVACWFYRPGILNPVSIPRSCRFFLSSFLSSYIRTLHTHTHTYPALLDSCVYIHAQDSFPFFSCYKVFYI